MRAGNRSRRRGFAIVLVAALAGLVFLLGASLVAITQLHSAAASYDQRTRLARENARAALDMAIAELQKTLGDDRGVSFLADVARQSTENSFYANLSEEDALKHPFWTGARSENGTTSWLVTKPLSTSDSSPAPDVALSSGIALVGKGSVGDKPEVIVPLESIKVTGLDGYLASDVKTIGRFAYWVGDQGVKSSLAWYDKGPGTGHANYSEGETPEYIGHKRLRLRQLRMAQPHYVSGFLDTNDDSGPTDAGELTNPERIDAFVSDFQFRGAFDDSDSERYLFGFTEAEYHSSFWDVAPLSKGLLTNSASGGYRKDLSAVSAARSEGGYDADLLNYIELSQSPDLVELAYDEGVYRIQGQGVGPLPIRPAITQFNLNFAVYLVAKGEDSYDLGISYAATVELWNPFTSSLGLDNQELLIEFENLPDLAVWINSGAVDSPSVWSGNLDDLNGGVRFVIEDLADDVDRMRPGEMAVFQRPDVGELTLPESDPVLVRGPVVLAEGSPGVVRVSEIVDTVTFEGTPTQLVLRFVSGTSTATSDFRAKVSLRDELGETTEVATFDLDTFDFGLPDGGDTAVFDENSPSFGFSWELSPAVYADSSFSLQHPLDPDITAANLQGFNDTASAIVNADPTFDSVETSGFFGYIPDDGGDELYIPILSLPKQELTSLSQLNDAFGTAWLDYQIGTAGDSYNSLFDSTFISTIPDASVTDWSAGDALPNSAYVPLSSATEGQLRSLDSAESLYVNGMFNVHSTSIAAWTSLLKSNPVAEHEYWLEYATEAFLGEEETELPNLYLFSNSPAGGEDVFRFDATASGNLDEFKAQKRRNMFILTDQEVEILATKIVSNIRKRVQGTSEVYASKQGHFTSLQDFVDSGVLENAIAEAVVAQPSLTAKVNSGWTSLGSKADFTQATILNLIAPYLSVRSDTFLVRAYGDAVDPANPTKVWARAYCEAILQRTHDVYNGSAFERRFEIVAFRWLDPSEI